MMAFETISRNFPHGLSRFDRERGIGVPELDFWGVEVYDRQE